jgi:putative phosphoribosyl transferase
MSFGMDTMGGGGWIEETPVEIPFDPFTLHGTLRLPAEPQGVVLFAHGSGSSRFSPRNRVVAEGLGRAGFATVLMDLLTAEEGAIDERTRRHRFDIDLLAGRVAVAIDWMGREPRTRALPAGLFGASTGAAAALVATAERPDRVHAVVSRGGRPDMAGPALAVVQAPTLLIVGGADEVVLAINRQALDKLGAADKQLAVIPRAGHLFEEPGALEAVTGLAARWFSRRLGQVTSR